MELLSELGFNVRFGGGSIGKGFEGAPNCGAVREQAEHARVPVDLKCC